MKKIEIKDIKCGQVIWGPRLHYLAIKNAQYHEGKWRCAVTFSGAGHTYAIDLVDGEDEVHDKSEHMFNTIIWFKRVRND